MKLDKFCLPRVLIRLATCLTVVYWVNITAAATLAPGVRGVATRAPKDMKIDGDLSEFKGAFCTPIEYHNSDLRNRAAQFVYIRDEEAFYAGLRTLDKKPANLAPANLALDNRLW